MFNQSTELYDLIYSKFKDYPAEAGQMAELLQARCPDARRLLDVGCGSGRHAALLTKEHGYEVDGIDIEAGFVKIAGKRCPEGDFVQADMADFDLSRTYDAVICLFSSIGYVKTHDRLAGAARAIHRHVTPEGLALIEPWFGPEEFKGGSVFMHAVETEELKISRVSRSEVMGRVSRLEFQYLVANPAEIRHLEEIHELGLFTTEEMTEALEGAGFSHVEHDPEGITGRGLFLARP